MRLLPWIAGGPLMTLAMVSAAKDGKVVKFYKSGVKPEDTGLRKDNRGRADPHLA